MDFWTLCNEDAFLVMSEDVYSKAEQVGEAAMCLILCKAWSVNGLGGKKKLSMFFSMFFLFPGPSNIVQKINKNLNQYFQITM